MYTYIVSGYYFENNERKHFSEEVKAPTNSVAVQIVLGKIMWNSHKYYNDAPVKLDCVHDELIRG